MSNNDDFDFNRDDLFDDDFGDDDSGGDDFGSDDFDFGDDSDDFNIDDDDFSSDLDSALGGDDDFDGGDDDFATTESAGGGGTSRGFVIAAILMVLLFLVGIGLIVFILLQPDQATLDFEASKAAIETQNAVNSTLVVASETAAIENATSTEAAAQANATASQQAIIDLTASFVPPTETPTEDLAATEAQQTADAQGTLDAAATQVSIDATASAVAFQQTLNPDFTPPTQEVIPTETPQGEASEEVQGGGGSPVPINAVQQTATALAQLFSTPPTQSGAVPTNVITDNGTPVVIGGATENPGQGGGDNGELPETGLFDDIFQGSPTFIFLAAFGLLGVIVVSRSVRKSKRDE